MPDRLFPPCVQVIAYFTAVLSGFFVGKSIISSDGLMVEAVIDVARLIPWDQRGLVHMKKTVRREPCDVKSKQGKRLMFAHLTILLMSFRISFVLWR